MGHPWLLTRVLTVEGHNGFSGATQVSAYYYRMARHHLFKSQTHRERSKVRYGVQLSLFDEDDGERVTP